MSDDIREKLELQQMEIDVLLKRRQAFWETPRNIALLMAAVAAVAGALGYKFGSQPSPPPVIINNLPPAGTR